MRARIPRDFGASAASMPADGADTCFTIEPLGLRFLGSAQVQLQHRRGVYPHTLSSTSGSCCRTLSEPAGRRPYGARRVSYSGFREGCRLFCKIQEESDEREACRCNRGSLRKESLSRKIALNVIEQAKGRLDCRLVEIGALPLYNDDLEAAEPQAWQRFRSEVAAADAVLFVTPEYNRSIPGVLKNAVDVGSRPSGKSVFKGKPAGVISQTPYRLGAFGANHALRQTFVFLDMPVLQQPEVYIGGAGELMDSAGKFTSTDTVKLINSFLNAFVAWIDKSGQKEAGPDFSDFVQRREQIVRLRKRRRCTA